MKRNYNLWSFILCLIVLGFSFQALYALSNGAWQLATDTLILWLFSIGIFTIGVLEFKDKSRKQARWRSSLTVLIIASPLASMFIFQLWIR